MRAADLPRARLNSPRFLSFLLAQFCGAANDNAFKMTLTQFILASVASEAAQTRFIGIAALLFPLPFLLFSPIAGSLADRFSKGRYIVFAKLPEVLAMALAVAAFRTGNLYFLLAVLFLMATQSAFFSPVKYGLLPESFDDSRLSLANGILETTTNLAILVGSVSGVFIFATFRDDLGKAGWVFLAIALAGSAAALHVPRTPAGDRRAPLQWNLWIAARANWKIARRIPVLFRTLFGIAYFGFLGSFFLIVIPVYGKSVLGLSEEGAGTLLMVLSIGIAIGSVTAGRVSRGRVEVGLVPLGSLGLTLFSFDLALFGTGGPALPFLGLPARAAIDLFAVGASAGFYIIPLNALLQQRSPEGMKGRLIAFSNVLTFSAVLLAAVVSLLLTDLAGFGSGDLVLTAAALTLLATIYIVGLLPQFMVRLVLWILVNTIYRIRVTGEENLPDGGGLLVANHVSWMDGLLIGAATDRMIRFMMFRPYYEARPLHWFFRMMHVIPVAAGDSPEQKEQSLDIARAEIEAGHLVCIFAEGAITRTGNLLKFKRGFEKIARGMSAPIVPACLDGVWGSIFSWQKGRLLFKRPRQFPYPVRVLFGEPLAPAADVHEVRRKVQELSVSAFRLRKSEQRTLRHEFLRTAKRFWHRPFVRDAEGRCLRFGQALVRSLALREVLFGGDDETGQPIGILLPPGVPGALANLAVLNAGNVPVNLDGEPGLLRSEIEGAGLQRVITTRAHLARLGLEPTDLPVNVVFLEEAEKTLTPRRRRRIWCRARLLPRSLAARALLSGDPDDVDATAAVVFSLRPGEGEAPAGAALSHHNILSNMESLKQVFRVSRADRILGVLPLSSAFGLMGTLLLPGIVGVEVVYHDDPLDVETVARLTRTHRLTLLPVAPAHLAAYLRSVPADCFRSLRHAVVAGKPLADEVRRGFAETYGVEPLEGFGCAECSPLVSLNVPFRVRTRNPQVANRPGTAGHPLPGVAVKIVDPRSGEPLAPGEEGELLVKGPNVMQGYLNDPERTARVVVDGWFRTGHRASLDREGFLTIRDTAGGAA